MTKTIQRKPLWLLACISLLTAAGVGTFGSQLITGDPGRAWQAYLINFLLFSAIAHGAVLFSTLMRAVKARWSGPLADLAEAFTAFFPVSFFLFLGLFWSKDHLFVWLTHNLHGKEVWLNLQFLFFRDIAGLFILYGTGFAYLYHALWFKIKKRGGTGSIAQSLTKKWKKQPPDDEKYNKRMTVFAYLYMLSFALVLSLLGYDLVMSMDPNWHSTLFGPYCFVKAIYIGFGALIILAAVLHLSHRTPFRLKSSQFHDIGKLFFAFCLVWADFFYVQFVVIWYGNISEETAYIIKRTMTPPWNGLAWVVFFACFIGPFLILLNKKIKMVPVAMIFICSAVIAGMWLEHFLLLGPVYHPDVIAVPVGWLEILIAMGFFGLLAGSLMLYLDQFPEVLIISEEKETA
ncbi:MAG: hypothetical protein GY874_00135 [Desulfobacteraceae bacterium]|nr:hypothetical protein [Desulfobacteraceae bacterium]